MHTFKLATIITLLTALAALAACDGMTNQFRASRTDSHTASHVIDHPVHIQTRNGSINVQLDPALPHVDITVKLTCSGLTQPEADDRLAASRAVIERDGNNTLRIHADFDGGPRGSDGMNVTVRTPSIDGIDANTSNGSITFVGLDGKAVAKSSNGSIHINSHQGKADLHTSNGSVHITDHTGNVKADTSNASITANNLDGSLNASTSNGSGKLSGITGPVSFNTSNASINADLDDTNPGPAKLVSSNGSIHLTVGSAFTGSLSMSTSNGRVTINDPAQRALITDKHKTHAKLSFGQADHQSKANTSNASVTVTVRPGN